MLIPWVNSWVDLERAYALCEERTDLDALKDLIDNSEEKVEAALIQSYHALKHLAFRVPTFNGGRMFRPSLLTESDRYTLSTDFIYTFQMAQVLQADSLVGAGQGSLEAAAEQRQRAGIIQEAVGQSSTKYSNMGSKDYALSGAVNSRALSLLFPYIDRTVSIGRV